MEEEAVPEDVDESHGFGDVVVDYGQDAYVLSAFDEHLEAGGEPVDLELDAEVAVQDDYWPASRLSSDGAGGGLVDLEAKFVDRNPQNDAAAAVAAVVFDIELHGVEVAEAILKKNQTDIYLTENWHGSLDDFLNNTSNHFILRSIIITF